MRIFPKCSVQGLFLILSICLLVHPTFAQEPLKSETGRIAFDEARDLLVQGDPLAAIQQFQDFLSRHPAHARVLEAYFLLGQAYIQTKKPGKAIQMFRKINEFDPSAALSMDARELLADLYIQQAMLKESISVLEQQAALTREPDEEQKLYARVAGLYLIDQQGMNSIETLLKLRLLVKDPDRQVDVERKIGHLIQFNLDADTLETLSEKYTRTFPGDLVLARRARLAFEQNDLFFAERYWRQFLDRFSGHPDAAQAQKSLSDILDQYQAYRLCVGVLIPMAGPQAPYARSVFQGIQLAMEESRGIFPKNYVGYVVRDFHGEKDKLTKSYEELVLDYGCIATIGPLLSRDVERVAPLALKYRVPLISPTATSRNIVMDNPYIFRNGVTQRFRGKTLVQHAVRKFALNRFVIFYPEDAYGVQSMRILFEEINRLGGEVIVSESYPPDSMDFADEIRHVIEVDLGRYGALIPAVEMNPNEKPQYIPGFDAIIIHGDPLKSGMLAAQLVFHDVQDRILLVTDGERSPEFLSAGNRFVEGAIMVNEFFEESPDPIVRGFVERYRKRFREPPDLFSAQAYDSIQMILHAMESGYTSRDQLRRYLAQIHRFHGVSGMTSFDPSGQVEKSLFVIQVQNGKYVQVN